ncbi:MAG: ubiquinol-cytochrome c reductase iron-sulfur subunit [Planctomycetaceae bacterium]|nr:ubiquinol-cytochrome c reductase iron-sulfur subunit [Planctomycetaceae bacterium]
MVDPVTSDSEPRRTFVSRINRWLMAAGLLGGYGTFAAFIGRFLFPGRDTSRTWQYVADLNAFPKGQALTYVSPAGQRVVLSRVGDQGAAEDFIALSSVCPHLGCQVHWEQAQNRFFCPCHNGAFDPGGKPLSGPVKDANQSLATYPLKVERNLLFIEVSTEALV